MTSIRGYHTPAQKAAGAVSVDQGYQLAEWQARRAAEQAAHRCARCCGPYGKSDLPCPNEVTEIRLARAAAYVPRPRRRVKL